MSRLDRFEDILKSYEGREYDRFEGRTKETKEINLTEEEVIKALTDITDRIGMPGQIAFLDYATKEAIAKAHYFSLFCNVGNPNKQESSVNIFCQDLEVCLNNNPGSPGKVKDFAEAYAKNLEANS